MPTVGEIVVWMIIGGFCGSLVGRAVTRTKQGFGLLRNLLLGMGGSLVGGLVFNFFQLDFGWGDLSISFEDVIAGVLGSLLVLLVTWGIRKYRQGKTGTAA